MADRSDNLYDDGSDRIPGGLSGPVERVVVVGAGMAGLAAANALAHAGVDCLVIEARDRLGGRTHTVDFGNLPVDLGGSWIHHPGGNPLVKLADQLGLTRVSGDFRADVVLYDLEGGVLSEEDHATIGGLYDRFEESLEEIAAELGRDTDMATVCEHFLEKVSDPGRIRNLLRSRIHGWIEADASGPVADVAVGYLLPPDAPDYEGDDLGDLVVGGYRTIVNQLATGVEFRLSSPVGMIDYDGDGVRVILGDGTVEHCSHAIVTVPLGVLKTQGISFNPVLPEDKMSAISRLGFGRFEKVVIRFESPFWTENGVPHLLPLSGDGSRRVRAIFGLDAAFGQPVVTAFDSGADAVFRDVPDDEAVAMVTALLEAATGRGASPVVDFLRSDWEHDPWTRGAYTYCPVGSGYDDIGILAEPVAGRVLFAGEATSTGRVGYADGALTTGIREAKRLLGVAQVRLGPI